MNEEPSKKIEEEEDDIRKELDDIVFKFINMRKSFDDIGINYYSHYHLQPGNKAIYFSKEDTEFFKKSLRPYESEQGLYDNIESTSDGSSKDQIV